jgi:hypothetical protein
VVVEFYILDNGHQGEPQKHSDTPCKCLVHVVQGIILLSYVAIQCVPKHKNEFCCYPMCSKTQELRIELSLDVHIFYFDVSLKFACFKFV